MTYREPLFLQHDLLALDGGDLVLIGRNHGRVRRFDDPGEKAFNLPVELDGFIGKALRKGMGLGQPLIPSVLHQRPDHRKERRRRRHGFEHRGERTLDLVPLDRLALLRAGAVEAGVIGVTFARLALGPRRRQGPLAAGAGDRPAQGEVGIEIGAGRSARTVFQALLNTLEGLERDEPFMLSLAERDAPVGSLDISGIKRLGQDFGDEGIADHARAVLWERRTAFQKALHFGLRVEPA